MWNVLPKFFLVKTIFSTFFLLIVVIIFSNTKNDFAEAIQLSSVCTLGFLFFIFTLAKWLWKPLWKIPKIGNILNRNICPDLNGSWTGRIESSFVVNGSRTSKDVIVEIKADFFGFTITLRSADNYSTSKVVQSEIYKDPRTGTFYISYIFQAEVHLPEASDDKCFEGAARLEVIFLEDNKLELQGTYWTNRAWQRNQNTAGMILLSNRQ